MLILVLGVAALFLGYLIYSRFIQRIIMPFQSPTPAVSMEDGIDYVPMSKWKDQLIQPEQSLKHVIFMGSMEADEMDTSWSVGPSEIAVRVANLLMKEDGFTQNEALVAFMKSETFRRLMRDGKLTELSPERLLEMYREE